MPRGQLPSHSVAPASHYSRCECPLWRSSPHLSALCFLESNLGTESALCRLSLFISFLAPARVLLFQGASSEPSGSLLATVNEGARPPVSTTATTLPWGRVMLQQSQGLRWAYRRHLSFLPQSPDLSWLCLPGPWLLAQKREERWPCCSALWTATVFPGNHGGGVGTAW